jgi:dCMP deaminase
MRGTLILSSKWDSRYISLAQEVSTWSKDPSTKIGAVAIGEKGQVLAQGYNGFPRGIDDNDDRYYNKEQKYKYVVHAEMNCIYNATYNGVSLQGATIYISGLPVCSECAKGLIQVGIKRVVYHTGLDIIPKKWIESNDDTIKLFDEAGVTYDRI